MYLMTVALSPSTVSSMALFTVTGPAIPEPPAGAELPSPPDVGAPVGADESGGLESLPELPHAASNIAATQVATVNGTRVRIDRLLWTETGSRLGRSATHAPPGRSMDRSSPDRRRTGADLDSLRGSWPTAAFQATGRRGHQRACPRDPGRVPD